MSSIGRFASISLAAVAVLAVTSCGVSGGEPGESPESEAPKANALAKIDPCTVVPAEKLQSLGYSTQGTPVDNLKSEPGCRYRGEASSLRVYRNAEETIDSYDESRKWDEYAPISVGSREARRALTAEDKAVGGVCTVVIASGGGLIRLDGSSNEFDAAFDACGELERVAQAIESDLPK